MFELAVLLF